MRKRWFALAFAPATPTIAQRTGDASADRLVSFTPGIPASERWNNPLRVLALANFNEANASGRLTLGAGSSLAAPCHASFGKSWT